MKRIAAIALGGLLATPALAGGPVNVVEEPAVAPAPVMAAPSIDWTGFYAGGELGYGDVDTGGVLGDGDGPVGGILAGYRYDFGRAVVGAELSYDITGGDLDGYEVDNLARLKLMAGGEVGERGLLYATAGSAWADISAPDGDDLSDNGWFYGVGYDHMLNDQWFLGAELLRHEFNDFDDTGADVDANTLQLRAAYRF